MCYVDICFDHSSIYYVLQHLIVPEFAFTERWWTFHIEELWGFDNGSSHSHSEFLCKVTWYYPGCNVVIGSFLLIGYSVTAVMKWNHCYLFLDSAVYNAAFVSKTFCITVSTKRYSLM